MNVALINGPSPDGSLFTREGRCTQKASIWSVQLAADHAGLPGRRR
jgi:hypothetical protein